MDIKQLTFSLSLLTATMLAAPNSFADDGSFSKGQQQQIQQIVHDYLIANPDILIQMSQKLQQQQVAEIEKNAQKVIPSIAKDLFNNASSPVSGNTAGTVTLVEFFDYQCPHCKDMTQAIDNIAQQNNNLRIVYKELPIFGGSSDLAARAALAANMQGKYPNFHDALMNTKDRLTEDKIMSIAKQNGLNVSKLKKDMNSNVINDELKQNRVLAQQLKLVGTPAFIIGLTNGNDNSKSILIPGSTTEQTLQQAISQVQG